MICADAMHMCTKVGGTRRLRRAELPRVHTVGPDLKTAQTVQRGVMKHSRFTVRALSAAGANSCSNLQCLEECCAGSHEASCLCMQPNGICSPKACAQRSCTQRILSRMCPSANSPSCSNCQRQAGCTWEVTSAPPQTLQHLRHNGAE